MDGQAVIVRFSRPEEADGFSLRRTTEYQLSVDGGPRHAFRSPWDDEELEGIITTLRNESEDRPGEKTLAEIGQQLGASIGEVPGLVGALTPGSGPPKTVYWSLDYPELARIPWELASWWESPYHHIMLTPGIKFVRSVPLFDPGLRTLWPTGVKKSLGLLFVWGEHDGQNVPHDDHEQALAQACENSGVSMKTAEVATVAQLTELYESGRYDFVHILAHGARDAGGEWGLRLSQDIASGTQVARALRTGRTAPAMVTVAACDSGNETDNRFSSVAYQLHAHGVPMVLASQFRLRKSASTLSVSRVYEGLLAGRHPLDVVESVRDQLSPSDTEAWANEVVYTSFTLDELDHGAKVAQQQGALRRARVLAKKFTGAPSEQGAAEEAKRELRAQILLLQELADDGFDPGETYGLLGSMQRRIAYIGTADSEGPDEEALLDARDFYEQGLRADMNSHYCGINALHLSWLTDDREKVAQLSPIVDYAVEAALERPDADFWVHASAGEAKVYLGKPAAAVDHYRSFVRANRKGRDPAQQEENLASARRQLAQVIEGLERLGPDPDSRTVSTAASQAAAVLDSALARL